MSKHLSFYVQFHVKSECIGEFKERAMYVLENMSKEDTFEVCYFHQDAEDPTFCRSIYGESASRERISKSL